MRTVNKIEVKTPQMPSRKKVAAYARVSMESERLQHSLSAQVSYYSALIQKHPDWEYAGVYADDGISGTKTAKRDEFNRLLEDCEAGKIDIVLTKSISRFARNTVDLLNTVRRLKELGISVRFEKEHIDSLTEDGELMLTLLASFAQEESRSISENVKWGTIKRFKEGIPNGQFTIFGYKWVDGRLTIIPEEAEIIRWMYAEYMKGASRIEIGRALMERGIYTRQGKPWVDSNVKVILTNITYTGNFLFQKEYVVDPISKKSKKNRGELPQYFVENTHEAIIPMEEWQAVQAEFKRRRDLGPFGNKALNTCCFTGKIKCPHCGCSYMHSVRNARNEEYWICGSKKKKRSDHPCPVKGVINHKVLKSVCAEVLGLPEFDEDTFLEKVDHIEVPLRATLDFYMKDGTTIRREAKSTGHQDCWTKEYREKVSTQRRKTGTNPKGASCFTAKIKCPTCGCNFRKQGSTAPNGTRVIYWRCADHDCGSKGLREDWLKDMCAEVMGTETFSATDFSSRIDHIDVSPDTELTFIFTNGDKTSRLWPKKKKGHKASEHQKEVMREHMKKRWTPEYRQYMSERMKQIRREKKWPNP